jgi:hypothetical protein
MHHPFSLGGRRSKGNDEKENGEKVLFGRVDCQRAFKSFLFPREMSVVLFFVSSAIQK